MGIFQKVLAFIFCTIFLLFAQSIFAQKKLKSGFVVYEIENVETNVPELKLMKGTKTTLYFNPENQKIDVNLNNENIKIQTFYNNRNDDIIVLYDFVDKHFKVNSNLEDNLTFRPYVKDIKYQRLVTKSIAGYSCYKTEITFEDEKITLWVTDKIKVKSPDFQSIFPGLEGFPLEYIRRGEHIKMTFKATTVNEILPANVFDIPEKYEEISKEEFSKKMGGMKFGF